MHRIVPAFLLVLISFTVVVPSGQAASVAIAKRHMIVAAEPDAAAAGRQMLRQGGSAVDAAIAAQMVLTLEEPQSSGIGGGAYLIVSDNGSLSAYDGRETAPASATPGMFLDAQGNPRDFDQVRPGGLSVGVPGVLRMLTMAHGKHGKLPWGRLFQPAIHLAEDGFIVPPRLARELAQGGAQLAAMPGMRALFYHPDGTPVKAGERWRNPELAKTLRAIAMLGADDAFYSGAIADDIAQAVSHAPMNPTMMTPGDIAGYQPKERAPLCAPYRGYRVCGVPPSTSGGTSVLQILGLLQRFPSDQLQQETLSGVHLLSEASRLAYADRGEWLGDTDFVSVPLAGLLDPNYLAARSQLINPMRDMGRAMPGMPPVRKAELPRYAPMPEQIEAGTSQISAVDDNGEAISMTTSVESAFGAEISADGFLLNNQLTDFSFEPVMGGKPVANAVAAGKRPLSSMAPTLVFAPNGTFFASVGSPGGRLIIGYVAQTIVALIDGQMSMQAAAEAPRHINMNGATLIEANTPLVQLAPALTAMGHQVRIIRFDSGINGIKRVPGGYEGGADPHREGAALGD
jgi:gamma-glutamyltranspeptidase/glutathione hydrolase